MALYQQHLQTLIKRFTQACERFNVDVIILHSGSTSYYAGDDLSHPFHPNPMAQQWLPYNLPPDTWIVFQPGVKPLLLWPAQQDFWHVTSTKPEGDWTNDWTIQAETSMSWLSAITKTAALFSLQALAKHLPQNIEVNPTLISHWLNYDRAYKTAWEINNIRLANDRAVVGHQAAEHAFFAGKSEFAIHLAYLKATEQQQIDEPYGSIIAVNEASAILHYERKNQTAPSQVRSLLIDAGVKVNGYASDITRTFTPPKSLFADLVDALDALQLNLVSLCTSGTPYPAIHDRTLQLIAELLKSVGLCRWSIEEQLAKKIPQVFFPHGIGHLLGLQVHDVGGLQVNQEGNMANRPDHAPFLRLLRTLEDDMVVTIEPGLYFIPMLIQQMEANQPNHGCDMALIEKLIPFGGIRIEDNIVIKQQTPVNLTRDTFTTLD